MKRLHTYILILLSGCIAVSCDNLQDEPYDRFSYICAFFGIDKNRTPVQYYNNMNRLVFNWKIEYIHDIVTIEDYYRSNDSQLKELFYDLCLKYNDVHYNSHIGINSRHGISYSRCDQNGLQEPICAVSEVITGVEIVSDKAWDAAHPAGALLNDLFDIIYYSFAPYIASGYDAKIFSLTYGYTMPLSDITPQTLSALDANRTINFFAPYPASGDAGTLTVTLSLDSGAAVTFTVSAAEGE